MVHILFTEDGVFRRRAYEPGGHVRVQGVRLYPCGVLAVTELFQELERDAVALVKENGLLGIAVSGRGKVHLYFPYVHRGIPDPHVVLYAAALLARALVGNESAVGEIFLSEIVGGNEIGAVVRLFVLEGSGAAVALHLEGYVQRREYVLGGEHAEVVRALCAVVKEVAVVLKLRVRSLGVEHGNVLRSVCPGLQRGVELR